MTSGAPQEQVFWFIEKAHEQYASIGFEARKEGSGSPRSFFLGRLGWGHEWPYRYDIEKQPLPENMSRQLYCKGELTL